jgi:outer membrane protein assembly factor BamB
VSTLFAAALLILMWHFSNSMLTTALGNGSRIEWPQWRGPNRDGVSQETGLLNSWQQDGPKVLWRIPFGHGYSGISILRGRLYTMFAPEEDEFVVCLNASNGEELWRFRTDSKFTNEHGDGPRSTPTVNEDAVFALGSKGKLHALDARNGERLWEHDLVDEFGSKIPGWGFATSPLVEANLLVVEVGGKDGKSVVAFDKKSGDLVWTSPTDEPGYSSPIAITFNGIRQIIIFTSQGPVSVSPTDGKIYWKYLWPEGINIATPLFIPEGQVFVSASYDKGAVLVKMTSDGGAVTVDEVWKSRVMKNHFNASVLHGNYLYGFDNAILKCIEANTGAEQWVARGFGKGSLIFADGNLIVLGDEGRLALVEATPLEYREKGDVQLLQGKCWTAPTLAGGRLYVRNHEELVCLDVTGEIAVNK